MRRAPPEFADMLSKQGRALLTRRTSPRLTPAAPFVAHDSLLDAQKSRALLGLMNRHLFSTLKPMVDPIPKWTIAGMQENYGELLPKTVRVLTATFDSPRSRSWQRAAEIGVIAMLQSPSMREFAQKLSGYALRDEWGVQALCYRPGDYAGPHNDHHPEDAEARQGYVDVHLTFATDAVDSQLLVYERKGHLSEVRPLNTCGGVTCYRLPFWHYTTPLLAKPGRAAAAKRWVLLSTFLDQGTRGLE